MTDDKHLKAPWYRLPKLVAMPQLVEIRNQLRRENLHDTEEPALEKRADTTKPDQALLEERTVDGSYNDLEYPSMGSCGKRFGRNCAARTHLPGHRESHDAKPARRQPRADDEAGVSTGHHPESHGRVLDSVHGARLVRAQTQRDVVRRDTAGPWRRLVRQLA